MDWTDSVHLDLDGAWPREPLDGLPYVDARAWGPPLRYSTNTSTLRRFEEFLEAHPARFILSGSGDFHHLSALWLRRLREPFTLVSFDNHPDWDVRPPRWGCGTWISRALESPLLEQAFIWGCGNFELDRPMSLFANHRGLRAGRLHVRPWRERLKPQTRPRWQTIEPETWRSEFAAFAESLAGRRVYITVDLDCLRTEEATTNWENGLFSVDDIVWATREISARAAIVAGDVCGAYSPQEYARFVQGIEARLDHPKLAPVDAAEAQARNVRALLPIWSALTGRTVSF